MAATVGFLRAVKLAWMHKAAQLVLEDKNVEQIREELTAYLGREIKSATSIRKTRDILTTAWINPSKELADIRKAALAAYIPSGADRYALPYCALLAAFPIFADTCALIGKLATIQDEFTTAWLREKLFEIWGERETVADALKYILQTLTDFGVIVRTKAGSSQIAARDVASMDVIHVMLTTILRMKERSYYEVGELASVPWLFPFRFSVSIDWLHNAPEYQLNRCGGKMTVALRE